jgi:methylated-DNA-[protein]-cysteine S-methyltransferase
MVEIGHLETAALGRIWIAASSLGLAGISLWDEPESLAASVSRTTDEPVGPGETRSAVLSEALLQVTAYFDGSRQAFDLPIDWRFATPFHRAVLELVLRVPFGRQSTYREIAEQLGRPGAVRAVGRANATNPIPIVIPCHRILGADGKLHGYSAPGGLETKAWLLRHEGSWLL